jgi:hypothetical protein
VLNQNSETGDMNRKIRENKHALFFLSRLILEPKLFEAKVWKCVLLVENSGLPTDHL